MRLIYLSILLDFAVWFFGLFPESLIFNFTVAPMLFYSFTTRWLQTNSIAKQFLNNVTELLDIYKGYISELSSFQ